MGRFTDNVADTVGALFAASVVADPTRPLLTYYDDGTGERTELSGATLDNWVAKTANLLVDGCGLGSGDRAAVRLPPHWQSAAVLLGCWSAGLALGDPPDVLFATATATDGLATAGAPDRFALGLAPMALPLREVPAGFLDYVVEVRPHGDRFAGSPVAPSAPARDGESHADLCARARTRAAAHGLLAGDRVLVDASAHPDPLDWLLAPLAVGASVVLCAALDRAALAGRITAERVTSSLV